MNENKIIVALDGMQLEDAYSLTIALKDEPGFWGVKLNDFLLLYGISTIKFFKSQGIKVMCDPKLFDIPNTMHNSLEILYNAGADIITVHLRALYKANEPFSSKIAGVTILTSEDALDSKTQILDLLRINMFQLHYPYVVCAPRILNSLRLLFKGNEHLRPKIICPGIRTLGSDPMDQNANSLGTPRFAIDHGADLIVVGRSITKALNPLLTFKLVQAEISALELS